MQWWLAGTISQWQKSELGRMQAFQVEQWWREVTFLPFIGKAGSRRVQEVHSPSRPPSFPLVGAE